MARALSNFLRARSVHILRIVLGIVFLWFGALKIFGVSPVVGLVQTTYPFFGDKFMLVLGIWEILIGLGLIFKVAMRFTLALLWLQMLGTFGAVFFAPAIFFDNGNPLFLTSYGEFVVKNLVLVASSLVIAAQETWR